MNKYYFVQIYFEQSSLALIREVSDLAMENFNSQGVEEFSMNEEEVDSLLGDRSYSGGDLPESVLNEVDSAMCTQGDKGVKAYFYDKDAKSDALDFIDYIEEHYQDISISLGEDEWQDWNEEWRKHFKTIEVNHELHVIPSWEEAPKDLKYPLTIYPGMGFGTGGHETTFLCLEFLTEIYKDHKTCLDYGCGSSILGIGAKMYGVSQVDLYDIDENAMTNSKQNIDLNFKNDKGFSLYLPQHKHKFLETYDLVFANILAHILLDIKEELDSLISDKGDLILSGILKEQSQEVIDKYEEVGLTLVSKKEKNDWVALHMRRS